VIAEELQKKLVKEKIEEMKSKKSNSEKADKS
jgi:hypothetical protein